MRRPRSRVLATAILAPTTIAAAGGPLHTHGLPHVPLGEGEIAVNESGHLVISHIGPSGKDGARVDLGDTAGGRPGSGELLAGEPPDGASIVINDIGTYNGGDGWPLGGMQIRWLGGTITVGPHLAGLAPATYTINVYLGDDLLFSRDGISWLEPFATVPRGQTTRASYFVHVQPSPRNVILGLATDAAITVEVPGDSFVADRMEFVPDGETPGIDALNSVALCLASTGDTLVDAERLRALEHWHSAAGNTRMAGNDGSLVLSNLGPGGEDALTIDVPGAAGADVTIAPLDFVVVDDRLRLVGHGRFGEGTADLGRAEVYNPGGLYLVDADFAGVSAANDIRLQVVADGVVLETVVVDGAAPLAAVIGDAGDGRGAMIGAAMRPAQGGDPAGYAFRFDRTVAFDPLGEAGPVEGDEIRLLVEAADDAIGPLATLTIGTTGLGSVSILAIEPGDPCPWDLDGNGIVGFVDVVTLLSLWGPCKGDCRGDFDGSGDVGFVDVVEMLANWGEC